MPKMAAILARRGPQRALKDTAHGINTSKSALVRDCFHAVSTFFQPPPSRFHPKAFDKFRRSRFHFAGKNAGKISRAHCHSLRELLDGQRLIKMIQDPGFQFAQRFPIRELQ